MLSLCSKKVWTSSPLARMSLRIRKDSLVRLNKKSLTSWNKWKSSPKIKQSTLVTSKTKLICAWRTTSSNFRRKTRWRFYSCESPRECINLVQSASTSKSKKVIKFKLELAAVSSTLMTSLSSTRRRKLIESTDEVMSSEDSKTNLPCREYRPFEASIRLSGAPFDHHSAPKAL